MRRVNGPCEAAIKLCEAERAALNAGAGGRRRQIEKVNYECAQCDASDRQKCDSPFFRGGENLMDSPSRQLRHTPVRLLSFSIRVFVFSFLL
jgi:hypothetical protein